MAQLKIFSLLVTVGGLVLLSPLTNSQARSPSDLDPAFGNSGKVTTDFLGEDLADVVLSIAIQGDGKIVVAGYTWNFFNSDFAVMRYDAQGNPDPSFGPGGNDGGDGRVMIDFGGNDIARALLIQENGRIVVAGSSNGRWALACLNPDGSLDTSSDSTSESCTSDGKAIIDLTGSFEEVIYALALQGDGKVVCAGSARNEAGYDFAVGRFKKTSASTSDVNLLDQTFHFPGYHLIDLAQGLDDEARAMVIEPRRGSEKFKILVAGYAMVTDPDGTHHKDFVLARFLKNGELDTDFDDGWGPDLPSAGTGRQGFVLRDLENRSEDVATSLVIERNPPEPFTHRIYVAGYIEGPPEKTAFVRYNSTGLEIGYSTSVYRDSVTSRSYAMALYPQNDEYVVIAGGARNDFALEQYQHYDTGYSERTGSFGGGLDENFSGGRVLTDLGGEEEAHAIAIQPDGKIVVAGSTFQDSDYDFALARYIGMSADLSLDLLCSSTEVTAGNNLSYTVTVTNQGPHAFLNEASLMIRLPSVFTQVIASSHGIDGCTTTSPITCHWPSYLIDSGPLTLEAATNRDGRSRNVRTIATISGVIYDPRLENNSRDIVVRVLQPRRRSPSR